MTRHNPPAVVNVTRGDAVESTHRADIVVSDERGRVVAAWGEVDRVVYPRSSVKALQAIPLMETGAADAFGFQQRHIALACASHNGEPMHVETAREMLDLIGLSPDDLECGVQEPARSADLIDLAISGRSACALHNNCSGKHAGFLACAQHGDLESANYIAREHPVQQSVARILEEMIGVSHEEDNHAIDGCSVPTYRVPLDKLATAFARFGSDQAETSERRQAMARLRNACFEHPEMVAGAGRACTAIMSLLPGQAFVKIGAEGVYTASLPEHGYGVALKVADGESRAAEVAVGAVLDRLLELAPDIREKLNAVARPQLKNRRGMVVGRLYADL